MADQRTAQKLWCIDQVLRDKRATHFDFRLAYYIASVTDRATGEARFKQSTAAEALDVTRRTIQISSERLKALGHIDISFTPGRTHVNGYRLCLEKANVASPLVGEMANEGTPINDGNANLASPIPQIKGEQQNTKGRILAHEKANRHSHQSIPCLIPCLIPSRAREPSIADALSSLGAQLEARLGADRARSWFGKAAIIDVVGNTLTLELPTRFVADRVRSDFEPDLLACCKKILPTVERVMIVAAVATTGRVA